MNTNNSINISQQNVKGNCDSKCSYSFSYANSNSTAKNNGVMISLSYDGSKTSPVSYNNNNYNVSSVMIITPSIHIFNGKTTDGEILIEHAPVLGGNNLFVCIPIVSSNDTSNASSVITNIITYVSDNAPANGDSANLNLNNFTLNSIVPKKPYFNYINDNKASTLAGDYIVFNILDAIPLTSSILTKLGQIIKPYNMNTPGSSLYYNPSGPNSLSSNDDIYISCKPTGFSKDTTEVRETNNNRTPSLGNLFDMGNLFGNSSNSEYINSFYILLIIIMLFLFINVIYNFLTKDEYNIQLPKISMPVFNIPAISK
jgi:hypothetical protein